MTLARVIVEASAPVEPCGAIASGALNVDDAVRIVTAGLRPLRGLEEIDIDYAAGRVIGRPILSPTALPRFSNSAMDGYAVHASDLTARAPLFIAGGVRAGQSPAGSLQPACCIRVATGAPVPPGTSAVVPDEDAEASLAGFIRLKRFPKAGANVRKCGEDVGRADVLIEAGSRVDARHIALMRAAGLRTCPVHPRVRVGLLAVGSELAEPGQEVGPGKLVDVNRALLRGLFSAVGAEVLDFGIAADRVDSIAEAFSNTSPTDLLLTTGGMAGSEYDVTLAGLEAAGGKAARLHLALKPGRAVAYGKRRGVRTFHLPGNPIAALVAAHLLAVPAIAILAGDRRPRSGSPVIAGQKFHHRRGRTEFTLARADEADACATVVWPVGEGSSSQLMPLCGATGFVEIPAAAGDIMAGEPLRYHSFDRLFG